MASENLISNDTDIKNPKPYRFLLPTWLAFMLSFFFTAAVFALVAWFAKTFSEDGNIKIALITTVVFNAILARLSNFFKSGNSAIDRFVLLIITGIAGTFAWAIFLGTNLY